MKYLIRRILETPFLVLLKIVKIKYYQYFGLRFINRSSFLLNKFTIKDDLQALEVVRFNNLKINEQYTCLGFGVLEKSKYSDWYYDDFHNYRFPFIKSKNIDYVSTKREYDVKVVWEKSRLQFALRQSIRYRLGQGIEFRHCALNLLESWFCKNPFGYGPNWISSMEVAIRGLNIYLTYLLLFETLNNNEKDLIHSSLLDHYIHLKYLPEFSDVNGNHYLFTLIGKAVLGRIFGQDREGVIREIEKEIDSQFDKTGAQFEYSPSYSRFCLEGIQVLLFFIEDTSIKVKFTSLVSSLVQYTYQNKIVEYGDYDDGSIFDYDQDFTLMNLFSDEYVHGCLYPIKMPEHEQGNCGVYGNIAYLKCYNHFVTIRFGEPGLNGRASHDHDDVLSLRLFLSGKEILKEFGTPSYSYDTVLRERCLSSLSHNVVQVGRNERFEPVQGSVVKTVRGLPSADLIQVKDGFLEVNYVQNLARRTVIIKRSVEVLRDSVRVVDLLEEGEEITQFWHLNTTRDVMLTRKDSDNILIEFVTQDGFPCKIALKANGDLEVRLDLVDYYPRYARSAKIKKLTVMSVSASFIESTFYEV